MKCGTLVEVFLWPHLAVKGLMSFQIDFLIFLLFFFCLFVDFFFYKWTGLGKMIIINCLRHYSTQLKKKTTRSLSPMLTDYFTVGSAVG